MQKNEAEIQKLPPLLTVPRVADIAGVSRRTVRQWHKDGLIRGERVPAGGLLRFDTVEVLRFLGIEIRQ